MNQDSNEPLIYETPSTTPDFKTELAAQLAELMPEVVADGKIDVVKLRELLGEDVGSDTERFGLFWPGKKRALRAAQEPTTATLRPDKANSKDWDTTQNVFIEGDNLEVLKILQKHYHNKIKLIYIDPPYNTGRDFVYPDNFKEGLETYLDWTRQVNEEGKKISTNSETEGRYHSNWLNMMYPRLKLARNLLTDDGLIMISIDDNEVSQLRRLCDEVFGETNFVDCVIWKKRYGGGAKEKYFVSVHEYVLVYARNLSNIEKLEVATSKQQAEQYYKLKDEYFSLKGPYRTHPLEAGKAMDARPNLVYPITAPDGSQIYPKRQWLWSRDRVEEALRSGELEFTRLADESWSISTKQYLYDETGQIRKTKAMSLIDDVYTQHGTNEMLQVFGNAKVFQYPKPTQLLLRLIEMADTSKTAIVLDFFAGSASSAVAVMKANLADGGNRKFIQVQLPEPVEKDSEAAKAGFRTIADIARERLRLTCDELTTVADPGASGSYPTQDLGFRSFTLADTSFAKWRVTSSTDRSALEQHLFNLRESANNDATPDDFLTELLLKQGYSLTEKISESTVFGLNVQIVGENLVIAYLTESVKPTLDQLRALVDQDPQRIIMLEDAFQGDDELKTNLAQLCKSKGIELWTA